MRKCVFLVIRILLGTLAGAVIGGVSSVVVSFIETIMSGTRLTSEYVLVFSFCAIGGAVMGMMIGLIVSVVNLSVFAGGLAGFVMTIIFMLWWCLLFARSWREIELNAAPLFLVLFVIPMVLTGAVTALLNYLNYKLAAHLQTEAAKCA